MDPSHETDALLVTNPSNILYLTGFVGVSPTEREAYVLKTHEKTYLFTNRLYKEKASSLSAAFVEISRESPFSAALAAVCTKERIRTLGFEDINLTVAELTKLKESLKDVTLMPSRDAIETLRMTKRNDELASIKLAASVTDQCFAFITKRIRPGTSEARLAWEIEAFLRARGGALAFTPIVAFNEHSSQPHYHEMSNNPLRKNSLVLLDFGARVNGYCADMTRVVFLGQPKPEWTKAYETTLAANEQAITLMKDGERHGATLDAAAQEIIAEAGLPPYPHSLGHAVGLEIHEAPRLSLKKDELLKPNMAVTVEPGTYIDGEYGIRIEDLVLVKHKGIEVLSKSRKELTVL